MSPTMRFSWRCWPGEDGLDPRQYAPQTDNYTAALGRGVSSLRIGVV